MNPAEQVGFLQGTLSHGSAIVTKGTHLVYAGLVVTALEGLVHCHVKLLDQRGFFVESVCAWALRQAAVPAPHPCWVWVNKSVLPKGGVWPYGVQNAMICFGTRTVPMAYTLRQEPSDEADARLLRWPAFAKAGAFDEALANDDRGHQNILTDGKRFWLIDNERALANRNPGSLLSDDHPYFSNTLLDLAGRQSHGARLRLQQLMNPACGTIIAAIRATPLPALVTDAAFRDELHEFLEQRSDRLLRDCMKRLGLGTLEP